MYNIIDKQLQQHFKHWKQCFATYLLRYTLSFPCFYPPAVHAVGLNILDVLVHSHLLFAYLRNHPLLFSFLPLTRSLSNPLLIPQTNLLLNPVRVLFPPISVIKDKERGFVFNSKRTELYVSSLETRHTTHTLSLERTRSPSLIWVPDPECALVSSGGWWKLLILRTGQKMRRGPEHYQRDPNDLWALKHRRSVPPHELPLISHRFPANTWLSSDWERLLLFFYVLFSLLWKKRGSLRQRSSYLPWAQFSPISVLQGCCLWRGEGLEKIDVEGVTADNGMEKRRRWWREMET